MSSRIAWIFPLGHGHAAQFENLRDSCSAEISARSVWVGGDFYKSGDRLANLPYIPDSLKRSRNEIWHFTRRLGSEITRGDVLFVASWNLRYVPYMHAHPSYFYADFSPSLMRQLSPWYDHFYRKSRLAQAAREFVAASLPRSARAVFAMSSWCARGISSDYGIDPRRVHVVHGGANLDRWHFVDRSDHCGPTRILMVGGEFRRKGGDDLLSLAERVASRDIQFDIVTWPGQLPDRVRDILGNPAPFEIVSKDLGPWLPNVRVHCGIRPNTKEILDLFARADIFCLPTQGDFSSIASLEAMATGLPVVVGAVGGIPELIDEGETGFLVQPGSVDALERALEPLIADRALRLRVGRAARVACEERFNTRRQASEIVRIIDADLAGADPGGRVSVFMSRVARGRIVRSKQPWRSTTGEGHDQGGAGVSA